MSNIAAEIVLTGGPCAGKTTALNYIQEQVTQWGYRVLMVPETATLLMSGGVTNVPELAEAEKRRPYLVFQGSVLDVSLKHRAYWQRLAQEVYPDERCVLLFDRGPCDGAAYLQPGEFRQLMEVRGLTLADVRDCFDAIIHLTTAADGAEEAFWANIGNNPVRREGSVERAIELDRAVQQAWVGHPHLRVVDNSTDFAGKLKAVVAQIARVLGEPVPLEIERKYLVEPPDTQRPEFAGAQRVDIQQSYLTAPDGEEVRVRSRSQDGQATYYLTRKVPVRPGVRTETERRISAEEYTTLLSLRDPSHQVVCKERWCWVYAGQYLELDFVRLPLERACCLLEIELTEEQDAVELPPYIHVVREVTDDAYYSNAVIALG